MSIRTSQQTCVACPLHPVVGPRNRAQRRSRVRCVHSEVGKIQSLKRSAEHSKRRKAAPYRSALSMLVFYINRAAKDLPAARRKTLERAMVELRRLFCAHRLIATSDSD